MDQIHPDPEPHVTENLKSGEQSKTIKPMTYSQALAPAIVWGVVMTFASVVAFILLVHATFLFGLGSSFRYEDLFEFVSKFIGSGVCLTLSINAGIFSFLYILGTKTGGAGCLSFIISIISWTSIGIYFVVFFPETLNDNPPFLVVAFMAFACGIGYPVILIFIMNVICSWLGIKMEPPVNEGEQVENDQDIKKDNLEATN
jgi:hypothetical protein